MALLPFRKTWQISPNNALAAQADVLTTNRTALLNMFNALLGLGSYNLNGDVGAGTFDWYDTDGAPVASPANFAVVRYSCNSTAVSSLGMINITTPSHVVFNSAGNAHSWIVLDFTEIEVEVLIACDVVSAQGASLSIVASAYGVTGNRFSGGTTTANPTAAGSYAVLTTASWGGSGTTNAALKIHVWKSDDGEAFEVQVCNGGEVNTLFRVEKPVVYSASWSAPSVVVLKGAAAATSVVTVALLHTTASLYAYAAGAAVVFNLGMPYVVSGTNAVAGGTSTNGVSGEWDMFPQWICKAAAPANGFHGELNDVWWAPTALATTNISKASSPYPAGRLACIGDQYRPWVPGFDFEAA